MDATDEDEDIRLRKISNDLLGEFDAALHPFLRRPASKRRAEPADDRRGTLRAHVRVREADRLVGLINPFQELPQLLDGHLAQWLPALADAFLGCVAQAPRAHRLPSAASASLVQPLQAAVARLIYTFCKVRGEKVVVGFLPVETRYLEPLLGALEAQERWADEDDSHGQGGQDERRNERWTWEERYIVLLWLAQLFLAPFDLATISTGRAGDEEGDEPQPMEGFAWPGAGSDIGRDREQSLLPSITVRVLPLAMRYLAASGKERDAARVLLVRVAMRRDMQQLGVRHALVQWALHSLQPAAQQKDSAPARPSYYYIGTLSFLAGILGAAAGTSDMDDALERIFAAVHAIADSGGPEADETARQDSVYVAIRSSALARKMMIKTIRAVAVRYIQRQQPDAAGDEVAETTIETTIGYLLERLADNDTPVRLAASKALSIIALKLDPDMAAQVIDAVLEGLHRNVLAPREGSAAAGRRRDLTAVDPLEWHGLMLTLSHLLYRRSPPLAVLPDIVAALHIGLAFERRSVSGSAMGTNVRDAACFGIWALARRYTTAELRPLRVLQPLATDLVVAACLDPAGNIRRGSSAALQELIGRHPDTVRAGIDLVQAVDYHAVALRGRAATDVALQATLLAPDVYGSALRDELLGWRGATDAGDAVARRSAAASFGQITRQLAVGGGSSSSMGPFSETVQLLVDRILQLQARQVEERHGLVLSLAAVLDAFPGLASSHKTGDDSTEVFIDVSAAVSAGSNTLAQLERVLSSCQTLAQTAAARRPELLAEAASRLMVSSFPIIQEATQATARDSWTAGPELVSLAGRLPATEFSHVVSALGSAVPESSERIRAFTSLLATLLSNFWLIRQEAEVIDAASDAALVLLVILSADAAQQKRLIQAWTDIVRRPGAAPVPTRVKTRSGGSSAGVGLGYVFALAKAYPLVALLPADNDNDQEDSNPDPISQAILDRWKADKSIGARVALLQALAQSPTVLVAEAKAAPSSGSRFQAVLAAGLDDYTTDARGDVGSHVRLQALRATRALWTLESGPSGSSGSGVALFLRVLRLSAEKLDRVRVAAQATLAEALPEPDKSNLLSLTFSSQAYFGRLLGLWDEAVAGRLGPKAAAAASAAAGGEGGSAIRWMAALMRGCVTSADTGNEELVIASRAALVEYVSQDRRRARVVWQALLRNLPATATTAAASTVRRIVSPPDRIVVPTLEILSFLFYSGIFGQRATAGDITDADFIVLCRQVHSAAQKAGSVRKLEACIKVYGAVAATEAGEAGEAGEARENSRQEARQQLAVFLQHAWPRIRSAAVDELWGLGLGVQMGKETSGDFEALKGVDWGTAEPEAVEVLTGRLGLAR